MNKNKKFTISVIMSLVFIFTICIFKTKASNIFDENTSQINAKKMVNDINLTENKKLNDKFDKVYNIKNKYLPKESLVMENKDVKIQADSQGTPDFYLNKLITSKGKINNDSIRLDNNLLKQKAQNMADKLAKQEKTLVLEENNYNAFKTYKWARTYKGYKYDFDFVITTLDPSTGEIAGASKQFISYEPSINIKIKDDEAKKIATDFLSKVKDLQVGESNNEETIIVNPNYRWTNKATNVFNPNTRLAYSFTFDMIKPYEGKLIIWIDVEDGSVLGGYVSK